MRKENIKGKRKEKSKKRKGDEEGERCILY